MSQDPKTFSPFRVGEIIPAKGFNWRVLECNKSEVRLQVCGVSKSGKKMGYKITFEKDDPLKLHEAAKLQTEADERDWLV